MSVSQVALSEKEIEELYHRQWEERRRDSLASERYSQAKHRMKMTYLRLLTKNMQLVVTHLLEVSDFVWRRLEDCVHLVQKVGL
jgi:hypothetical protein